MRQRVEVTVLGRAFLVLGCILFSMGCGSNRTGFSGDDGGESSSSPNTSVFGDNGGNGDDAATGSFAGNGADGGPTLSTILPTTTTPFVLDDTPKSKLPAATIAQLKKGGSSCTTRISYPYPMTMFAAEGVPPSIMWSGAADAAYIAMTYGDPKSVYYQAAIGSANPGTFPIPQAGWNGVTVRTPTTKRTPLQITLSVLSGGSVSTCHLQWLIAPGALAGSIYYNSYDDPSAVAKLGFASGTQGAVLRLPFGKASPDVFLLFTGPPMPSPGTGPCYGCHSVSARGSSMAATLHNYGFLGKEYKVFGYNIQSNPNPNPPPISQNGIQSATFGALTPDGKYLLTMGVPDCTAGSDTFPRTPNNMPLIEGPAPATLWDVAMNAPVSAPGLDSTHYIWMPQFSPDGDKVVFNNARPGANGRTDRRQLATMDYDAATHTFSNLQVLYTDDGPAPSLPYPGYTTAAGSGTIPTGAGGCTTNMQPAAGATFNDTCNDLCYPGWPFFTPDAKKVIFSRGTEPDFASMAPGLGRNSPSTSKLFIIDVATKVAQPLANVNAGMTSMNLGYEYFPTVMPVAAGGQFWMFFTSRRTYGNTNYAGLTSPDSKKIWGAAIDIGAPDNVDPSHPPFYLMGQGNSGNIRAFPTLNPCKNDGSQCSTGLDCCGGTCNGEGAQATCGPPPVGMCAKLEGKCTSSTDCCDPSEVCLGGFCAQPAPPK
jgi:hypothetical protein